MVRIEMPVALAPATPGSPTKISAIAIAVRAIRMLCLQVNYQTSSGQTEFHSVSRRTWKEDSATLRAMQLLAYAWPEQEDYTAFWAQVVFRELTRTERGWMKRPPRYPTTLARRRSAVLRGRGDPSARRA